VSETQGRLTRCDISVEADADEHGGVDTAVRVGQS
jgi:hypothetical protein